MGFNYISSRSLPFFILCVCQNIISANIDTSLIYRKRCTSMVIETTGIIPTYLPYDLYAMKINFTRGKLSAKYVL